MICIITVHFNYILITYSAFVATSKLNMSVHWPWFCTDHECVLTKNMLSFRGKVLGFRAEACYSIFSFICMFCRSFCPFVLFLLVIVLSVLLRYADSDCPFRIFTLLSLLSLYLSCFWWSMYREWNAKIIWTILLKT